MIYGIGNDLCDVRRMRAAWERRGPRLAATVLGPAELIAFERRQARWPERGLRYLATRFSAKEAFSKAIGLGMHAPMTWRRCEILNLPTGQPRVVLHGPLRLWFEQRKLLAHISITDEADYVASFCVVERAVPAPAAIGRQ